MEDIPAGEQQPNSGHPPHHQSVSISMEDIPLNQATEEGPAEDSTPEQLQNSVEDDDKQKESATTKGHVRNSSRIGKIYHTRKGAIQTVASAHNTTQEDDIDTAAPITTSPTENDEASWGDVCRACCCHTRAEWFRISIFLFLLLACLYFFLFGLDLLGTSFRVVGGCTAASLLGSDTNPLASVMIGIIATALLQSSSTTTSIIVSLVGGGLNVQQGIYMVMGANVGTSITSMLVSLSHLGDGDELERAFSAASVGFCFKFLTVIILLPLEVTTSYLYILTKAMLPSSVGEGDAWEGKLVDCFLSCRFLPFYRLTHPYAPFSLLFFVGPIKKIISPLTKVFIIANKELISDISTGAVESCDASYPVTCTDGVESYLTCNSGLIGCNSATNKCPAFFQDGASKTDDMISGWVCLIVALFVLIVCLIGLVALLRAMLLGASTRIIYKATNINPILAMIIGCGVTVLVQSSSITTSALIPLAGVGVLQLEQIYPLTLGADIGTTFTALMAAMVSSKVESLQIALAHLFFNLTGIVIWYPIPFMRHLVMKLAKWLGKITRHWRSFPAVFIALMYFLLPLLLLGISTCFEQGTAGFTALGVFLLLLIFGAIAYFLFWWYCKSGKESCQACIRRRQRKSAAIKALADDMEYLKVDMEKCNNEIGQLKDLAGLPRMEEGRPLPEEEQEEQLATEEDEALTLYESCQSKPWRDVLVTAAGSIQSDLQGSTRMPRQLHNLQGSTRLSHRGSLQGSTRQRRATLQSSTRTHASARRSGLQGSNRSSRRGS